MYTEAPCARNLLVLRDSMLCNLEVGRRTTYVRQTQFRESFKQEILIRYRRADQQL